MKCNLIYEDFNLFFDKENNPILNNAESIQDYQILKDIFLDEEIMKSSSAFCGEIPDKNQFYFLVNFFLNIENKNFRLKKIYSKGLQENKTLIGLGGLILINKKFLDLNVLDFAVFIKKEFQKSIYGYHIIKKFLENFNYKDNLIISSCLKENKAINKFASKMNFVLLETYEKKYKNKPFQVNFYIKYEKSNQNSHKSDQNQECFLDEVKKNNLKSLLITNNF
jgi:hypothetical protein